MPNRIIKDTIHLSETVNQMTDFQFRLWVNLITYVDDYGRGDARPAIIKGLCFPLRNRLSCADIGKALQDLAGIGCIFLYEVDGKPYLCFPTWESHQNIRNKKSKFPGPEDANGFQTITDDCNQLQSISDKCSRNPIQSESESNPNPNSARAHTQKREKFVAPTVEQVAAYITEKGYSIDAQHFWDYYNRQGWRLSNGQPMKDWQSAVRLWSRDKKGQKLAPKSTQPDPRVIASMRQLMEEEAQYEEGSA